jgi:hypothetical protein
MFVLSILKRQQFQHFQVDLHLRNRPAQQVHPARRLDGRLVLPLLVTLRSLGRLDLDPNVSPAGEAAG